jgi:long-chain acyl-CoA synthetase
MAGTATRSFWNAATAHPDRPAVIDEQGRGPTFAELADASARLAQVFANAGARPGNAVVCVARNSADLLQTLLACLYSGLYFVPTSPKGTAQDIAWVIEDCRPVVVVADTGHATLLRALNLLDSDTLPRPALFSGTSQDGFVAMDEATAGVAPMQLDRATAGARLLYTGGTTGRPKGVKFPLPTGSPAEAADRMCALWAERLGYLDAAGPHLVSCPLYHGLGLMTATVALHLGNTLVLTDGFEPQRWLAAMERHTVATTSLVPTMLARLMRIAPRERARHDLSALRSLVHSGAPCAPTLKRELLDWLGDTVWEFYGASEAVGTTIGPVQWRERPGSAGLPLAGAAVVVVDETGRELPAGQTGEILIRGAGGRATFTGSAPVRRGFPSLPGYVSAGDIGHLDEDGYLFITDRVADIIVSGGVNVYSARVEAVLAAHPEVELVSVIGEADFDWGERVVAVVQPRPAADRAKLEAELVELARRDLAAAHRPKTIEFLPALPLTRVGKIDKRALKESR